jgi:hypothetical protein
LLIKARSTLRDGQISTGHGAWRRKKTISRYALGAMPYAFQVLITTPNSKGKSETLNQTIKLELFVIDR